MDKNIDDDYLEHDVNQDTDNRDLNTINPADYVDTPVGEFANDDMPIQHQIKTKK